MESQCPLPRRSISLRRALGGRLARSSVIGCLEMTSMPTSRRALATASRRAPGWKI